MINVIKIKEKPKRIGMLSVSKNSPKRSNIWTLNILKHLILPSRNSKKIRQEKSLKCKRSTEDACKKKRTSSSQSLTVNLSTPIPNYHAEMIRREWRRAWNRAARVKSEMPKMTQKLKRSRLRSISQRKKTKLLTNRRRKSNNAKMIDKLTRKKMNGRKSSNIKLAKMLRNKLGCNMRISARSRYLLAELLLMWIILMILMILIILNKHHQRKDGVPEVNSSQMNINTPTNIRLTEHQFNN